MNGLFLAGLAVLALQRMVELAYARHRARGLVAQGAVLVRDDGMGLIVATHTAVFVFAALEWWRAPWARIDAWSSVGLALFVLGEALRLWAIATLGSRWNTRVYVLPHAPLVAAGPFRWIRHPNYVGVSLVLLGFPLMFHLYATAAAIAALNTTALARRIMREERALGVRGA